MRPDGQVYFLHAPTVGLVKIGRSIDMERRLQEIRLLSPVPLELLGVVNGGARRESAYHRKWSRLRQHGEWFTATEELRFQLWSDSISDAWNAAPAGGRREFLEHIGRDVDHVERLIGYWGDRGPIHNEKISLCIDSEQIDGPVFDRTAAAR